MSKTKEKLPSANKAPLALAASALTEICDRIDEGLPISDAVLATFNETKLELAEAVDRRIAFDTWIKGAIGAAKAARDEWASRAQQLDAAHVAFKEATKAIVEANPNLPYEGGLGKIAIQRNPPSLDLSFGERELSPALIEFLGIPEDFYSVKTQYLLDTKKVKAALEAGQALEWASIKQGNHVRFRK